MKVAQGFLGIWHRLFSVLCTPPPPLSPLSQGSLLIYPTTMKAAHRNWTRDSRESENRRAVLAKLRPKSMECMGTREFHSERKRIGCAGSTRRLRFIGTCTRRRDPPIGSREMASVKKGSGAQGQPDHRVEGGSCSDGTVGDDPHFT